ncbi:MAG: hypothetical protein E7335_00895 [Clostridiales bacterium]|nr:hypothetical protein [Clostridiales bacterium]
MMSMIFDPHELPPAQLFTCIITNNAKKHNVIKTRNPCIKSCVFIGVRPAGWRLRRGKAEPVAAQVRQVGPIIPAGCKKKCTPGGMAAAPRQAESIAAQGASSEFDNPRRVQKFPALP